MCKVSKLMQMDQQKRFPIHHADSRYHVASLGRGSAIHEGLEQRPVDWEPGNLA